MSSGSGAALRLEGLGGYLPLDAAPARPVLDRGRAWISEAALNALLAPLPFPLKLHLLAGEASLEAEIHGFRAGATLLASASPNGRLQVEATGLKAFGWLPLPPDLLSFALGRLSGLRGVYVDGQRRVELDLPELLARLPVLLDVRLSHVRVEPGWLELHCVPRAGR